MLLVLVDMVRFNAMIDELRFLHLIGPKPNQGGHDESDAPTRYCESLRNEQFPVRGPSIDRDEGIILEGAVVNGLDLKGTRGSNPKRLEDGSPKQFLLTCWNVSNFDEWGRIASWSNGRVDGSNRCGRTVGNIVLSR